MSPPSSSSSSTSLVQNPSNPSSSILHISFNQDQNCFSTATTSGFTIFQTKPLSQTLTRTFPSSISILQMLYRCNILALVFTTTPTKIMIWDDHKSACIGELTFRSNVKSVRLRRDKIVAVLGHKVYVYNFTDLKLLQQIETEVNPKGLCEVSHVGEEMVMVCLGLRKGEVRVEHYGMKKSRVIVAHETEIGCVALSGDGRFVATASGKGTLVRVFNSLDGTLLKELRRGSERAEIYSISFSSTAEWLAVSSDKGTVHIFSLNMDSGGLEKSGSVAAEKKYQSLASLSRLSLIKGVLPTYFSSEWSVAQFPIQEGLKHIVAFGHHKNTVMIITMDGRFYRCQFDPVIGGQMTELEQHNFLHPESNI